MLLLVVCVKFYVFTWAFPPGILLKFLNFDRQIKELFIFWLDSFYKKGQLVITRFLAHSISDVYIVLSKESGGEGYEICFGCNSNTQVWLGYNKGDAANEVGTFKRKQVGKHHLCYFYLVIL